MNLISTTPLFYATIGTLPGLTFRLGATTIFCPTEQDGLWLVDAAYVHVTAQVPDLFANFLRETVIEKRLQALGGGRP
jgi:hypothetical protein